GTYCLPASIRTSDLVASIAVSLPTHRGRSDSQAHALHRAAHRLRRTIGAPSITMCKLRHCPPRVTRHMMISSDRGGSMEPGTARALCSQMVLRRTYEGTMLREYHADKKPLVDIGAGLIPGKMHLAAGQEPVAAGVCAHTIDADAVTATHRPHHFALSHGVDINAMTAEIFGRVDGLGRGRGGHMHLFDPQANFSCSGIVGEGLPVAVGQALAFSRRKTGNVAIAVAGEGAANQGAFHESLNLAALWKLPVVFVIEDNEWGISVPRSASTSVPSNAVRAAAYGMPGTQVEDNSVEAVYEEAGKAVERARDGGGPSLIEVQT